MAPKYTKHQYGELCRQLFISSFTEKYRDCERVGRSLLNFKKGDKVLTLYSTLNNDRWWYGVSKIYWNNWDNRTNLALLMRDGEQCDVVLLKSNEAKSLFNKIDPAQDSQKKINVRIPSGPGQIYIQEWPSFRYQDRMVRLGTIGAEPKLIHSNEKSLKDLQILDRVKDAISKMTASEKKRFLDEIQKELL